MRKIVLLAVALMGFTAAFAQSDVLTVAQDAKAPHKGCKPHKAEEKNMCS